MMSSRLEPPDLLAPSSKLGPASGPYEQASSIQARLDDQSRKRLAVLVRELGWTPSRVVREGLRVLEASHLRRKKPGIIGLGKFKSGVPDLGSNKKHLRNFGR